jgi:hypothetical protein
MANVFMSALSKRVEGDKPSVPQAAIAALVAGVVCAALTYKVMRG